MTASVDRRVSRRSPAGFLPIQDYAVIGNKRTAALVGRDGRIDWMALPSFDGPSVFAAVLDPGEGGHAALAPAVPFEATRRYREDSCVLETTFETAEGTVRVTDAMSRPPARSVPLNEIVRRVDGVAGRVPMSWRVEPRFDYGRHVPEVRMHGDVPVFVAEPDVLAVQWRGPGAAELDGAAASAAFDVREGDTAVLALTFVRDEPLSLSNREQLLDRLEATDGSWRRWTAASTYDGPWADAVRRSALTLELLADERTGAMVAAPTMGLPEAVGGSRNFDYRYAWLRDTNLALEAMLELGFRERVHETLRWILRSATVTHPWLRPMYMLSGNPELPDDTLALRGYKESQPVIVGNPAQTQLQLGNFGDVLDMTAKYVSDGNELIPRQGQQLAGVVDYLRHVWDHDDASIWELGDRRPYTQSKLACWLTFTRAAWLAREGQLPREGAARWQRAADAVKAFMEQRCWSDELQAYARAADGHDELDAAVLLASRGSFLEDEPERFSSTIDAIRDRLGAGGALVYRFTGAEQMEGAFVACSFWAAEGLARVDRTDEAATAVEDLLARANDVGLYSEEIDPSTGDFLGNMPQGLSHLALITAVHALADPSS